MTHIEKRKTRTEMGGVFSEAIWQLREAIAHCLVNKGIGRQCHVTINKKGTMVELEGTVDTEWTHCEILAMLPDEERCVVDKIRVVPLSA